MRDIVLIHGAWHGGWCWAAVVRRLAAAGHRVYAPSLTGLADRAHLFGAQVSLATHVQDVVGLIEAEGLSDLVLVGHSYGGNVITGVGDRLRERVAHYVYLDAVVPPDDARCWRWADFSAPEQREARIRQIAGEGRGIMLPVPPASVFGLRDPEQLAFVDARMTPMPAATYLAPILLESGGTSGLRRSYVAAASPPYAGMAGVVARLRDAPGWDFSEIDAGHDMMIEAPDALAERLIEFAR